MFIKFLTILYPTEASFKIFRTLLQQYAPTGLKIHDVEIASIGLAHHIKQIATFNDKDFEGIQEKMNTFFDLFQSNRSDKSMFMTDKMASFFTLLATSLSQFDILRLCFLELDDVPVAVVMCFDYQSTVYLYNNGYDNRFSVLSVGLISKLLSIKDSIQRGKKAFNFLKGNEDYKRRLGGNEMPVFRCRIRL